MINLLMISLRKYLARGEIPPFVGNFCNIIFYTLLEDNSSIVSNIIFYILLEE